MRKSIDRSRNTRQPSCTNRVRGLRASASCAALIATTMLGAGGPAASEPTARDHIDMWKTGAANSVPSRLLDRLPDTATANGRKVAFIRATLPLILHANEIILKDRLRIEILRIYDHAGIEIDGRDRNWLNTIAEIYGAADAGFEALLRRVDIVPPSLALAQAAEESGWGSSRFARRGNALFGQRVFRGKTGMVPLRRPNGESYRVRSFSSVVDAVRAYLHNLNSHYAYAEFRGRRADMRRRGTMIDGYALTGTLRNYSERREDYLRSIRVIMRVNGLKVLDRAQNGLGPRHDPDA